MNTDALQFIDIVEAHKSLSYWRTFLDLEANLNQLEDFDKNIKSGLLTVDVTRTGEPHLARLCIMDENTVEEAIFSIQGFLVQSYLPPILSKKQLPKKALYATQSVYLTGFGEAQFTNAIEGYKSIQSVFSDVFGLSNVNPLEFQTWRTYPLFTTSNRFFTKQSQVPHEVLRLFKPKIDPKGLLLQHGKQSNEALVNVEENSVKYYERVQTDGSLAFKRTSPAVFELGDLVQADVSFIAFYNTKERSYSVRPVLRALYLLDDNDKIHAIRKVTAPIIQPTKLSLKRKLTIIDSDDEENIYKDSSFVDTQTSEPDSIDTPNISVQDSDIEEFPQSTLMDEDDTDKEADMEKEVEN